MPIHDWTRVDAGLFHDFHQVWTVEIRNALNRGILPPGYTALADQRVMGLEPDVTGYQLHGASGSGGLVVADAPPRSKQKARIETEKAIYARKANRIAVRNQRGRVVAIIEVVSPGNKDNKHAIESFTDKIVEFIRNGVNAVVIDLFPPGPRDPQGIHQVLWEKLIDLPFEPRPVDKPLTVASYDAGDNLTAYVDPVAVGDTLPDAPLFLAADWYINIPVERTYQSSWEETPQFIQEMVAPRT